MKSQQHNKIRKAMILAAGFGTRLKPITDTTPKALVKVGNKEMLLRNLELLENLGIEEVIINTHYLAEQITKFLESYNKLKIQIIHEPEILETGGGILNAMSEFGKESMLILNCDVLLIGRNNNPLLPLLEKWDENKMYLLGLLESNKPSYKKDNGDFNLTNENKISHDGKFKKYIFLGAYIISPKFFGNYTIHKFRVPDILFKTPLEKSKCYGIENKATWFDIGTHDSLEAANTFLEKYETKAS